MQIFMKKVASFFIIVLTMPLLLTSMEWSIATEFESQIMKVGQSCKTIHLNRAHPRVVLPRSPNSVWSITNHGPASVVIRTKSDPAFSIVYLLGYLPQNLPSPGLRVCEIQPPSRSIIQRGGQAHVRPRIFIGEDIALSIHNPLEPSRTS